MGTVPCDKKVKKCVKEKISERNLNFFLCYFSKSFKETMAKGKKQRKNQDSDDETLELENVEEVETVAAEPSGGGKRGKKDRKKKKEAELEEAERELEAIAAGNEPVVSDTEEA